MTYRYYSKLTVCSERFILVKLLPLALDNAVTKLVLPTPGGPSMSSGLPTCSALSNRQAFSFGPGASSE